MISNNAVAHNFAHNVKENLHSNSMFWESKNDGTRRIYSYGHHFCISIIDPAADVVLFCTRGYSNTTAKHIGRVRGALYQDNIIFVYDPEAAPAENVKQYAVEIAAEFKTLKKSQTRGAIIINYINRLYENATKYAEYKKVNLAPVNTVYAEFSAYIDTPEFTARLEKQAEKNAEKERIREEERRRWYAACEARRESEKLTSAERVAKWEKGENVYLNYTDTAENVPLRITARKGYQVVETGKGVIIPLIEARRVADLFTRGCFDIVINGIYKMHSYNGYSIWFGCHKFDIQYLTDFAYKVLEM